LHPVIKAQSGLLYTTKNKANKITNIADSSLPDAPAFALLPFSAMPALNAQA